MRRSLVLAAALAASCSMGAEVRVTGTPDAVVFELDNGTPEGPAVSFFTVSEGNGDPVWRFDGPFGSNCTHLSRVNFGQVPRGYAERLRATAPLTPGRLYIVQFSGCGYIDAATFKIIGGRIVYRRGDGDAPRAEVETMQ